MTVIPNCGEPNQAGSHGCMYDHHDHYILELSSSSILTFALPRRRIVATSMMNRRGRRRSSPTFDFVADGNVQTVTTSQTKLHDSRLILFHRSRHLPDKQKDKKGSIHFLCDRFLYSVLIHSHSQHTSQASSHVYVATTRRRMRELEVSLLY